MLDKVGTLLIGLALCIWLGLTVNNLAKEKAELARIQTEQTATIGAGKELEKKLDSLAGGTARLAAGGNQVAQRVVAILQANGVAINPAAGASAVPAPAPAPAK
jgi:hypothetical protein